MSSNKTTLPMSKEEDIVVFVKKNKNESKFPAKKLTLCVVLYIKFHLKRLGVGQGAFSCIISLPQGKKMFVENYFEILTLRKVFRSSRKFFRKVLHHS